MGCEGDGKCGNRCPLANRALVEQLFPDGMPGELDAASRATLKEGGVNACRDCLSLALTPASEEDDPETSEA